MKLQVSGCSTMHFGSDIAPIILCSDASDYGFGGYLFQTVNGIDQAAASTRKSQLRWSVLQKEAYGIFHSCMYSHSCEIDCSLLELIIRTYYSSKRLLTQ